MGAPCYVLLSIVTRGKVYSHLSSLWLDTVKLLLLTSTITVAAVFVLISWFREFFIRA